MRRVGGGGKVVEETLQLLFLSSPSPKKKEYLIARWGSFLKQQLAVKSMAPVG